MDDHAILSLYLARSEDAIARTREKYGALLRSLARSILPAPQDAEECENDTYLRAWNAIPPAHPQILSAYLARITRNLALNRLRAHSAEKRGGGQAMLSLEELGECVGDDSTACAIDSKALSTALHQFLSSLPDQERRIFVCRYFWCDSIADIAARFGCGQSRIKMILHRTRAKLRVHLQQEEIFP